MSNNDFKRYYGDGFDVRFYPERCIHAAECLKGLPDVFDVSKRPWINPANGKKEEIREVVYRCPSGALQFAENDRIIEDEYKPTSVHLTEEGMVMIKGNLYLTDENKIIVETKRATLCGCTKSENKPLCDLSCIK